MNYVYFDASAGLSGDMILAGLLDLGAPRRLFLDKLAELRLPVNIAVRETTRASLRGLRVEVRVKKDNKSRPRRWNHIEAFIRKSPFSNGVKASALAVFNTLFAAEAKVHGSTLRKVHLHEAAADDALVDILGSCYLVELLDVRSVYCSPLNVGGGWVKGSHGVLPVPPPAVAEILRNAPVYSAWAEEELVTPTGAAIIATLAARFLPFPEMRYLRVGCGAGSRDFRNFPNILRIFYGEEQGFRMTENVYEIEANIDDENPQLLAHYLEQALKLGALDAFLTPVVMKKGRLGTKLTLLAQPAKMDRLVESLFRETSSIGLRYSPVGRRVLGRETRKVTVLGEEVGVKVAAWGESEVNVQPEFRDCLKVAKKKNVPVKVIHQLALGEYLRKKPEKNKRQRGKQWT